MDVSDEILKAQVGARLSDIRHALQGGSAQQFAKTLSVNAQSYRRYERGENYPPMDLIIRLAMRGASVEYLLLGVPPILTSYDRLGKRAG